MACSIGAASPFQRTVMSTSRAAREYFAERGEDYKVDQVDEPAGRGRV